MKKILTVVLALTAMAFTVTAQTPKGIGNSDPDAKKILDGVSAKFKSFKSVQSKFSLDRERRRQGFGKQNRHCVYERNQVPHQCYGAGYLL